MIDEPGSFAGMIISPIPDLGPDANNRISFAILFNDTAICFSGELRTYNVAMPRILEYFSDFQADIFCHTWSTTGDKLHKLPDFEILKAHIANTNNKFLDYFFK